MRAACLILSAVVAVHAAPPARPALRLARPDLPQLHQLTAQAPDTSPLASFWKEHGTLILSVVGTLAVLAPTLRKLPGPAMKTSIVLVLALVQMAFDLPPDLVLLEAVVILYGLNVLSMKEALDGFRNEGVVTVAVMCAVAKGIQATGGLNLIAKYLLGSPKGYESAMLRMTMAVMAMSAFMNNSPVCAMMIPIIKDWAGSVGVASSALLMPVSFATMLGGTLTMIGSSTNLVAAKAAEGHDPTFTMQVFDISKIGLVNALAGTAYMVFAGRHLLPKPIETAAGAKASGESKAVALPRGAFRMWMTLGMITALMTLAARKPKELLPMALGVLCVLVRTGCLSLKEAWSAVNGPVLLSIALSFAIGEAIRKSELAGMIASQIVSVVAPYGELSLLFAIYFVAILIGAVISNNAVVALMFPIVVRICDGAGVSWKPALYGARRLASTLQAYAASQA